jgi:integrase
VRNELNVLKLGMNLARGKDLLAKVPKFPELDPKNVRTGFFERHELNVILAELPERVRPVALFLYLIGWRRREVTSRQWSHVDLQAETIRLDPGETKSGKGRTFPYGKLPELKAVIEAQLAYTHEVERRAGQIVPWVFHREGLQIKSFRTAWRAACRRTGIQRIPHDFRRTAARNMRRAGLSESDIMELCGWETREMFKRYAIKDEPALAAAVAKLAAAAPDRQVLPMKRKVAAK